MHVMAISIPIASLRGPDRLLFRPLMVVSEREADPSPYRPFDESRKDHVTDRQSSQAQDQDKDKDGGAANEVA
jgi:hypothetical protein